MQVLLFSLSIQDQNKCEIAIPFTINKYFKYSFLNQSMFDCHEYRIKVVSHLYQVDSNLIREPADFANHIPYLLRLSTTNNCISANSQILTGPSGIMMQYPAKFASNFTFLDKSYMMKINFYEAKGEVEFEILSSDSGDSLQHDIINVMVFLFTDQSCYG